MSTRIVRIEFGCAAQFGQRFFSLTLIQQQLAPCAMSRSIFWINGRRLPEGRSCLWDHLLLQVRRPQVKGSGKICSIELERSLQHLNCLIEVPVSCVCES